MSNDAPASGDGHACSRADDARLSGLLDNAGLTVFSLHRHCGRPETSSDQLEPRRFAVIALGSLGLAPVGGRRAEATAAQTLIVERRSLDINGKAASVFAIRLPNGSTGLTLDPGERFQVELLNKAGEETVIHWHGQTPPNAQDGVTETGSTLIAADDTHSYDFAPRSGAYWRHSHHGLQEQLLLAAPLVVRSAEDLKLDAQEVTIQLHDFTFRNSAEVIAHVTGGRGRQHGAV